MTTNYDRAWAIRGVRLCIAASSITCVLCVFGAYLASSFSPLSGIPSNVIAIIVGRFALAYLRRQP